MLPTSMGRGYDIEQVRSPSPSERCGGVAIEEAYQGAHIAGYALLIHRRGPLREGIDQQHGGELATWPYPLGGHR